jgi:hypothetical protein
MIENFVTLSQEHIGDFENHIRGIGSNLLRQMGYNGQGIRKRSQYIISPIVVELRVKHEGLCFEGIEEKAMTTKITFVKEKYILYLSYSLK